MSSFPDAIDPSMVGKYTASSLAGGGYFYDQVLEYRVWCHPERGAQDLCEGDDYYYPFETYEDAIQFSHRSAGAGAPFVLVRQLEWVDEPDTGVFVHKKGERITEWKAEWLTRGPRIQGAIEAFIKERTKSNEA